MGKETRVLFVCMGNICRSPAAEGILKHLVALDPSLNVFVESCGIGDRHIGRSADPRIREAALTRGIVLTGRAQQFQRPYFDQFDFILASDKEVLRELYHFATTPECGGRRSPCTARMPSRRRRRRRWALRRRRRFSPVSA